MILHDPSLRVPVHLTPVEANGYTPALTIYKDGGSPAVSISSELLTIEGEDFDYTTQSVRRLAATIGRTLPSITVSFHVEATPTLGELFLQAGDLTPQGGVVVRFLGFNYKALERTRIRMLKPYPDGSQSSWWVRINRGTFKTTIGGTEYLFGVPEYVSQPWSPRYGRPYMDLGNVPCEVLNRRMIRLPRGPVAYGKGGIELEVNNQVMPTSSIEDVDENNKLIYLSVDIDIGARARATYTYCENSYLYKDLDVNPSLQRSPDVLDRFVLFYLVPQQSSLGTVRTKTVRHVVSDTIEGGISLLPNDGTPTVLLGAIRTRQVESADEVSVEDARQRGGGLKEGVKARETLKESDFYTDIGNWDGKPYPGNAVAVFHVPRGRLEIFSDSKVREIAERHIALGTLSLVEYVD